VYLHLFLVVMLYVLYWIMTRKVHTTSTDAIWFLKDIFNLPLVESWDAEPMDTEG
jgi:hypothetical protein